MEKKTEDTTHWEWSASTGKRATHSSKTMATDGDGEGGVRGRV